MTTVVERRGRVLAGLRSLVPLGGLACIAPVQAEVTFDPSIEVGVAHTDNLTLAAENPEPETAYELVPAFSLRQNGRRMTADVDYRAEGYYYKDLQDSNVFQIYNADVRAALDPDNFFLEFGASREQTVRDPESPLPPISNLPISNNRVDRDDYYFGPSLEYRVGANATVRGDYRRTRIQYDEGETGAFLVPEYDSDQLEFSVDNYLKERGFTWAVSYTSDKTDYIQLFPTWEYNQAAVEIGTWVGKGARFYASAGKESPWDDPFDSSLQDDFAEIGFAKRVGENLNVDLAFGERSYGSSQRAELSYTFRHGETRLSYTDSPATQGRAPEDYLTRPGAAERFILKRFDWSVGIRLRRTDVSLTIYDEKREQRSTLGGIPIGDEAQSGAELAAGWQVGASTRFDVGVSTWRQEFTTGTQDLRFAWIEATRSLGARTDLSLELRRDDSRSASVQSYTADVISLSLTREL
jgi:hypothetical protein